MNETKATLILSSAPYLGPVKIRTLIETCGSCERALQSFHSYKFRKETHQFIENFEKEKDWQHDLEEAERCGITLLPYTSPLFPEQLKKLSDCPPLLYIKGALPDFSVPNFSVPWISIVGTRASTPFANEMAERFAASLARSGAVIVSGLARGVDTHAHEGALRYGKTVAVIGSGLSQIYPTENIALSHQIAKSGAVISELAMHTAPTKFTFPKRNRLIAALAHCTLLIEAPMKSGAMITMHEAESQGKKLYTIAHRAGSEQAVGNHWLIKKGRAQLVDNPEEILSDLNAHFGFQAKSVPKSEQPFIEALEVNTSENKILSMLASSERTVDELLEALCLPLPSLQVELMRLQIKKIILELPGKRYKLVCKN